MPGPPDGFSSLCAGSLCLCVKQDSRLNAALIQRQRELPYLIGLDEGSLGGALLSRIAARGSVNSALERNTDLRRAASELISAMRRP